MAESLFSEQLRALGRSTISGSGRESLFSTPDNIDTANIDDTLGPNAQHERDKRLLSPGAYARRYGAAAANARFYENGSTIPDPIARTEKRNNARSLSEITGDSLKSFTGGLVQGTAGIANLAVVGADASIKAHSGGVNTLFDSRKVKRELADTADFAANDLRDDGSSIIQDKRIIADTEKAPRIADSAVQYQKDLKASADQYERDAVPTSVGSQFSEKLKQIGRDSISGAKRIYRDGAIQKDTFVDNPAVAGDTVTQATGSLIPSLIGSGGTTAIARGVLGKTALKEGTKKSVQTGVTAGSVGAIEGQGAYNSTVAEISKMTEEQLTEGSKDYRALRAEGLSHLDAKLEIGDRAGKRAQMIQTGIASIAGLGVAKFEGNPLGRGSLLDTGKTLASQTVEEAFQSGSGQVTSNLGIRDFADDKRQITENVGQATAEGALGGFGATGVIKAPTAAVQTVETVAENGGTAALFAIEQATKSSLARVNAEIDKSNPSGEKSTSDKINKFEKSINDTLGKLGDDKASVAVRDQLMTEMVDTNSEEYIEKSAPVKDDIIEGSRIQTLRKVAAKFKQGAYRQDPGQQKSVAQFISEEFKNLREYIQTNRSSEDQEEATIRSATADALSSILDNKTFQAAEVSATEALGQVTEDVGSATVEQAVTNPVQITEENAELAIAEDNATETDKKVFDVVKRTKGSQAVTQNELEETLKYSDRARVRKELMFTGFETDSYGKIPSYNDLVSNVIKGAYAQESNGNTEITNKEGNTIDAQDSFERLGNLVQHQLNKLEAAQISLERSIAEPGANTAEVYQTLDLATGTRFRPKNSIYINARAEDSLETLQQVRDDVNAGVEAYNAVVDNFGEIYQGKRFDAVPDVSQQIKDAKDAQKATEDKSAVTAKETEQSSASSIVESSNENSDIVISGGNSDTTDNAVSTDGSDASTPDLNQSFEQKPATPELKAKEEASRPSAIAPTEPAGVQSKVDDAVGRNLVKDASGKSVLEESLSISLPADLTLDLVEKANASEDLDYEFTPEMEIALSAVLQELDGIAKGLNDKIAKDLKNQSYGKNSTLEDLLKANNSGNADTKDVQRIANGRVLSLIDAQSLEEGSPKLDDTLLGLALLATVDYLMNTPAGGNIYKEADVLQALGMKEGGRVTPEMWDVINFGRSATDTKEALGRHISKFWGAQPNNDISESQVKGIPEALADEIMDYLQEQGSDKEFYWLKKKSITVPGASKNDTRTYAGFRAGNKGEDLGNAKTIIRDLVVPSNTDIHQYSIGKKFGNYAIPDTLKKDPDTVIPEKKRKAIQNQQDTEFRVSPGFANIFDFFGEETFAEILGFVDLNQDVESTPYNINHLKSIEGKNSSIKTSVVNVREQYEKLKAYAEKAGQDLSAVPIHYRMDISRNGRFFMQGFNPQSNKLAREMFSANRTNLKTNDANHKELLYAAVAQALDVGSIKIENLGLAKSAQAAEQLMGTEYRAAVDVLKAKETIGQETARETLKTALAGEGIERSAKLLKALNTVATYELALENGDAEIEVDLAIELDGKTNGPISSAIQNNLEAFSEEFLALVRRGGFFIGGGELAPTDYADFHTRNDSADLYEAVGDIKSNKLAELNLSLKRGTLTASGDTESQSNALLAQTKILELLTEVGDVSFVKSSTEVNSDGSISKVPGELKVKRRGTKGPITEQLYGAGEASIAGGLTNAIFKTVYEEITQAIQTKDGKRLVPMAEIIDDLSDIKLVKDFETGELSATQDPIANGLSDALKSKKALENFSFTAEAYERIKTNIANLYVPAFSEALSDTVGSSVKTLNDSLVEATNTHTDIYLQLVSSALQSETQSQRDSGKIGKGDELSANDRKKILSRFRKYAPIIDVGSSVFNLSSGDQETTTEVENRRAAQKKDGAVQDTTFNVRSRTLSGKKSASKRDVLSGAGVRILPYNVIANADVAMITDTNTDPDMDLQSLSVHDGIETTLTSIDRVSQVMNKAVLNSWQQNTIAPVLQSLEGLYELRSQLKKNGISSDVIETLKENIDYLTYASLIRQAKIDALNTVQLSVDGVPGAQSPYVKSDGASFSNEQDLLEHLNNEMKNSLARQKLEAAKEKDLTAEDAIEIEPVEGSELRKQLSENSFDGDPRVFIEVLSNIVSTPEQKLVLSAIQNSPALQDIMDAGLKIQLNTTASTGGSYDMDANTLYISNATTETALHELTHAATAHLVHDHYLAPETQSDRGQAIKRLESLMHDFAARDYPKDSIEALVQSEIQEGLNTDGAAGKTKALNEFMAWSLSNEKLIEKSKKKVANDPLSQARAFGKKAIQAMRKLLGFNSNKVFDHIFFNTSVILNSDVTLAKNSPSLTKAVFQQKLRKDRGVGDDVQNHERKANLERLLNTQVKEYLAVSKLVPTEEGNRTREHAVAAQKEKASEAMNRVVSAGYLFSSMADLNLFRSLASVFSLDLKTNKVARLEAQQMFEAVSGKLSPETFLNYLGTDAVNASPKENQQANAMYRAAVGLDFEDPTSPGRVRRPGKDIEGNSDRLGVFLALSQTNDVFRNILEGIEYDELGIKPEFDKGSLDGAIESITRFSLQSITSKVINPAGDTESVTSRETMDVLAEILSEYDDDAASQIEQSSSSFLNRVNTRVRDGIDDTLKVTGKASNRAAEKLQTAGVAGKLLSMPLAVASIITTSLTKEGSLAAAQGLTKALNHKIVPNTVREFVTELRGRTTDNAEVFDLVKKAKQSVSSVREQYREKTPEILAAAFSDNFNNTTGLKGQALRKAKQRIKDDWGVMYRGLGRTDFAQLIGSIGESRAFSLFGDSAAKAAIRQRAIEDTRTKLASRVSKLGLSKGTEKAVLKAYNEKSEQLAYFQTSDDAGINLLRNAHAITGLYNENGYSLNKQQYKELQQALTKHITEGGASLSTSPEYRAIVEAIDTLSSIQAIDALPNKVNARTEQLIKDEREGIRNLTYFMEDLRNKERNKTDNLSAKINGYKGYMQTNTISKRSLIIANNEDHDDLLKRGYTRIRLYRGPEQSIGSRKKKQSYYYNTQSGLAGYNQGALQTVQQSYNGVDPTNGLTIGATTGNFLNGDYAKYVNKRMKSTEFSQRDALVPVFNEYGDLTGFEQLLSADLIDNIEGSQNLAQSLGNWAGRVIEEQASIGANQALMDALATAYKDREFGSDNEYVEFSKDSAEVKKDKILADNYRLIPKEVLAYGEKQFGGPIMIRRDMINNALGFRSASVSDVFTGNTRLAEPVRKAVQDISMALFGANAHKYLTTAENITQTVVSEVKHTIVVKSVVILGANTVSNIMQLSGREVPLPYMIKRTKAKYAEVSQFKRNEGIKIKLQADLLAAKTKTAKEAIQNKLEAIEESERRMSIWPLIENGEFTTISEGLTDADKAFMDGRFVDWIESKAGELPGPLSTAARYGIMSRDTALYQGLARGVQYSDFIAKAVYFDFLTESRNHSKEDALSKVTEEFINYDLVDGRTRSYLESIGLTWFLNFKIRAIKIALDLMRNNPVTALFTVGGVGMMGLDVGSVVSDNFVSATLDDRIGYSIGPGMVEAGWNLNIWKQIFG